MTGALGINTKMTDRVSFAIACGISGIAGASYHDGVDVAICRDDLYRGLLPSTGSRGTR